MTIQNLEQTPAMLRNAVYKATGDEKLAAEVAHLASVIDDVIKPTTIDLDVKQRLIDVIRALSWEAMIDSVNGELLFVSKLRSSTYPNIVRSYELTGGYVLKHVGRMSNAEAAEWLDKILNLAREVRAKLPAVAEKANDWVMTGKDVAGRTMFGIVKAHLWEELAKSLCVIGGYKEFSWSASDSDIICK